MSTESFPPVVADETATPIGRSRFDLFLISLLILFLELACIRWFPAHVLFLTFFTNTVLLACFLGISLGCLGAKHRRNYLSWTPYLLALCLLGGIGASSFHQNLRSYLDVGSQNSPQLVYFGTQHQFEDPTRIPIPIEVVAAIFFLAISLTFVGPGQELGRALNRISNRVQAYTLNILGSIVGIVLFAFFCWMHVSPVWWFLSVILGLAYFLFFRPGTKLPTHPWASATALVLAVILASLTIGSWQLGGEVIQEYYWSPYYRIDYIPLERSITVNLINHQQLVSRHDKRHPAAYSLPHLLHQHAGGKPFQDVLVIGAGSGNDLSRALQWGAQRIDAVEIDPIIHNLGMRKHPDQPYQDRRVHSYINDGRNFLRSTDRQYDLIIFALVDSLVLHSSYSNIRLENYLFTRQAFEDVKARLKPGGMFVMYNWFRQGWIVARLQQGLAEVFETKPLVLTLPYQRLVRADDRSDSFTLLMAGNPGSLAHLREAFRKQPQYWLQCIRSPSPYSPNGFQTPKPEERQSWLVDTPQDERTDWQQFGLAEVVPPIEPLRTTTDDWPFLYLRKPMIPNLTLRGIAVMGGLALLQLYLFAPRADGKSRRWSFDGRMFFLGVGFMLIETKAVVHMALLFGSTWMVNSVVFFAILFMILAANLFVLRFWPERLWPYYSGLFVALALNALIPLDSFLGMDWWVLATGSCLLVFAPIFFAGVVFAVSFTRTTEADRAFGFNIAGAMAGGLAENSSMLLGFQYLVGVAIAFYGLSAVWRSTRGMSRESCAVKSNLQQNASD